MERVISKPRLSVDMQTLADFGVQRSFRKGAIIVNEGETGDALYILIQGRVRVFNADTSGKEITLGTILAGDFFGEMSLDGGARSATVEALEPCLCAVVQHPHVLAFIRANSDLQFHCSIPRLTAHAQPRKPHAIWLCWMSMSA